MTISASGNNIRNVLALVRRSKGWKLRDSREVIRSGGENNCWRITLSNGEVVEITVKPHAKCKIWGET